MKLERLTGQEALAGAAQLAEIYRAAFGGPPWYEGERGAVSPHARGQGLAGRILDLLCDGADACWLLTAPAACRRRAERYGSSSP
ncbi:hypothetical protein ETD86_50905 [Nonomuraea turkmeniaca]|uniref:GNAT family N-acetyltransferase n=1 Tax=Nonomuraea turkmeniaca TaxID=103838 RepID=A0A5S4EWA6_9ACTN|nr:hypothetical protein [Nonomuraea turkmeniaca]TMR07711.1 hypothetical protein ETD86_50905 [Nonomuraea turkmeniaca]